MVSRNDSCPNFNHGRPNAPVRCCPMCGEAVNSRIPQKVCSEDKHAKSRFDRNTFCVDCGEQLIQGM